MPGPKRWRPPKRRAGATGTDARERSGGSPPARARSKACPRPSTRRSPCPPAFVLRSRMIRTPERIHVDLTKSAWRVHLNLASTPKVLSGPQRASPRVAASPGRRGAIECAVDQCEPGRADRGSVGRGVREPLLPIADLCAGARASRDSRALTINDSRTSVALWGNRPPMGTAAAWQTIARGGRDGRRAHTHAARYEVRQLERRNLRSVADG